ncbi:MAG: hypothetical protein K940chlam9_00241 [Chlamydiae bacterium]|nr:hypothetical protein [Chlamydiota bacterium]
MRQAPYRKYLLLGASLLLLLVFPTFFIEGIRHKVIALFSPAWVLSTPSDQAASLERLEGENHLLRLEIGKLRALLQQELVEADSTLTPARVIYRDPASWSSILWIDVGQIEGKVEKNSPVVFGRSVVGVIDYAGKKQSRVRLITDLAVKPSVRAVRGNPQNIYCLENIESLYRQLKVRSDLPLSGEEQKKGLEALELLNGRFSEEDTTSYLAKGIVQGGGAPLWRSVNQTLRGLGFNYDFSDSKGPARDLVTGGSYDASFSTEPLLAIGDLLVTTGLDGVFPAGLHVGEVTHIFPFQEGAYTYELEATPTVGNLDTLQTLFILPPLGYSDEESDEINPFEK